MIHCPVTAHCQFYWNGNVMNTNCWWLKSLVTNKVKDIYFKIIHQIYTTNHFIKKYRNDLDESFTFCKTVRESILHFFFFTIVLMFCFWTETEQLFQLYFSIKMNLQNRFYFLILFGKLWYKTQFPLIQGWTESSPWDFERFNRFEKP